MVRERLPAVEIVRSAMYDKIGKFIKSDIMELCPIPPEMYPPSRICCMIICGIPSACVTRRCGRTGRKAGNGLCGSVMADRREKVCGRTSAQRDEEDPEIWNRIL